MKAKSSGWDGNRRFKITMQNVEHRHRGYETRGLDEWPSLTCTLHVPPQDAQESLLRFCFRNVMAFVMIDFHVLCSHVVSVRRRVKKRLIIPLAGYSTRSVNNTYPLAPRISRSTKGGQVRHEPGQNWPSGSTGQKQPGVEPQQSKRGGCTTTGDSHQYGDRAGQLWVFPSAMVWCRLLLHRPVRVSAITGYTTYLAPPCLLP